MQKWNYITFLILLVPPMLHAQEENLIRLIEKADEFFEKLNCPEGLNIELGVEIAKLKKNPIPDVDFEIQVKAYTRYLLLKKLLDDPILAKSCGIGTSTNERSVSPRTFGVISDIWSYKMCLLFHHRCVHYEPPPPSIYIDNHNEQNGKRYNPPIVPQPPISPQPPITPQPPMSPQQTFATCTPIEQNILVPNGKVEKQKLLKCVFPNQSSVIIPMQNLENDPNANSNTFTAGTTTTTTTPPPQAPSHGGKPNNMNGAPNIVINQGVKVDVNTKNQ